MKKILSIVAIGALFTSYGFADNTTEITADIAESAIVSLDALGTMPTDGSSQIKFITPSSAIALGTLTLNTAKEVSRDIYVNTNSARSVKIQLATTSLSSTTGTSTETIPLVYKYTPDAGNSGVTTEATDLTNSAVALTVGKFSAKAGVLTVKVTPAAMQQAGNYTANVAVSISAI